MSAAPFPLDFQKFGFSDPTPEFMMVTTGDADGRAAIEGVVVIPGLPVCRVRMRADADRIFQYGPGRKALIAYIRTALHEDIARELPVN